MDPRKQERVRELSIEKSRHLIHALQQMDETGRKLLVVTDSGGYHGIISAGDIQRGIIADHPLDTPVETLMGARAVRVARAGDPFDAIRQMMMNFRTEFMPVLDGQGELVDVHFWDDVFGDAEIRRTPVDLPVVIMAGGKGTRLRPFSNILPKALFPIGERTILEEIMERFRVHGCEDFWLSVNHKADFIQNYVEQLEDPPRSVEYLREDRPLGTAGSLSLLRGNVTSTFFVTNCDILVDADYAEIVDYHREHENAVTLIGALKEIRIPYGTVESGEGGLLTAFREKPNLNYLINTGFYLLEPGVLDEIPVDVFYDMTQLVEDVRANDGRVGVFPVSEKSWRDIGEWQEYERTIRLAGS